MSVDSNQILNFLMHGILQKIQVPTDFYSRVIAVKTMLQDDVSGLVDSLTDFAVDSASGNYTVETDNTKVTQILKKWLDNINAGYKGQIPRGINALAEEYFKERWKSSSFPILKITDWETRDGLYLPTKMFFVDGESIRAKDKDSKDKTKNLLSYDYYLGTGEDDPLDKGVIITKPYGRWFDKYPNPYLIKRGVYHNWRIIQSLKDKQTQILDQVIPYLFLIKKGSEGLEKEGKTYTNEQLTKIQTQIQSLVSELDNYTKSGKTIPTRTTNYDEELTHFIPDLEAIFKPSLFSVAEKGILSGLGFIDVVEATSTSIDKNEFVLVKRNGKLIQIRAKDLEKEKGNIQVPTYKDGNSVWKPAKLWKHSYKGKMYEIISDQGRARVRTTGNHSIMVWDKDRGLISKRADELKIGDSILTLKNINIKENYQNLIYNNTFGSNQSKEVSKKCKIKINEDFAYLMGWYCAEGSTAKYYVNIVNANKDKIQQLSNIAEKSLGKKPYIYIIHNERVKPHWKPLYELRINSRGISILFKELFGKCAQEKVIPEEILNSPKSVQQRFMDGLLEGDGHYIKRDDTWELTTSSEELAYGTITLLRLLGKIPFLRVNKRWIKSKNIFKLRNYYLVRTVEEEGECPTKFIPKIKTKNAYITNLEEIIEAREKLPVDWRIKKILEINTYDYDDMVYDLEVEDNPTFVAGTNILVHNSRRESILNPKVFIEETKKGVKDFKRHILYELVARIIEENKKAHRKLMSERINYYIVSDPVKAFMTPEFKDRIRQQYDRGNISKQTAVELIAEVDFATEVSRRERESKKGLDYTLYPPIKENKEAVGIDIVGEEPVDKETDKNDKEIPDNKKDKIEKKEYDVGKLQLIGSPYDTIKSLPDDVRKKFSLKDQRKWMRIWNNAYAYMLGKTGNKKIAETYAFRVAWSQVKTKSKK